MPMTLRVVSTEIMLFIKLDEEFTKAASNSKMRKDKKDKNDKKDKKDKKDK